MPLLFDRKRRKKVILFLCTGDTCRGPMAQGYMKKAMEERGITHVEVKTAGVMTIPGLIPTAEAVQVLKNAGIDITGHRSSPLTHELIRKADLILGMTPFHVQTALRMSEEARGKTCLLKEFAESDVKNYQISDPMGMTLEVYKRVYREMKLAIDKMLETKEIFREEPEEKKLKRPANAVSPSGPAPTPIFASVEKKPAEKQPAAAKAAKTPPTAPAAKKVAVDKKPAAKGAPEKKPAPKAPKPAPAAEKKAAVKKPEGKNAPEKNTPEKKTSPAKAPAPPAKKPAARKG
jgi:protein-tyrosine phosphatase